MKQKMRRLKAKMYECDISSQEVAKAIDKSQTYVSQRICKKYSFTVEDAYKILKLLKVPAEEISYYFPPQEEVTK